MRKTTTYRRRIVKGLALGLAMTAVTVSTAQAGVSIPDELSGRQFGPTSATLTGTPVTIPPELSGRQFGPTSATLTGTPVTIPPELSGRQFGPAIFSTEALVSAPAAQGFDWRDAGVGAAVGATVALLVAASVFLIGRRRDLAGA